MVRKRMKNKLFAAFILLLVGCGVYFVLEWYQKDPINKNPDFIVYIGDKDNPDTNTYELNALSEKGKLKLSLYKITKTNRNLDLRNQRPLNQEFVYTTLNKDVKEENGRVITYQYILIFTQEKEDIDVSKLDIEALKYQNKEVKTGFLTLIEIQSDRGVMDVEDIIAKIRGNT